MEKSLFRYIWRHSRRDQLIIFAVVLASLPFYFASLDLPRRIVNEAIQGKAFADGRTTASFLNLNFGLPEFLGGAQLRLFEGFQVDRFGLLFGLSGLFLFFVLVNGGFKYWINVSKGALGERMLRRMRFELFGYILRFTPDTMRNVKSSEAATIIKDEVEPIGGFIGDAFVLPAFLGTQAATALLFIMIQSVWLGLMAAAVVGVQFLVIPKLRRELLRLGKQRQLESRRLAGRVGEVVDGIEAVHVHDAHRWERAEIGHRLYQLFDLRFRIYKRKFMVKFLNNLLAQVTPFLFYAVGGYFALTGRLDIGQLVAVIGAYRELPPPLKELIDWDQQRLDVQVKYDQVVAYFAAEKLLTEHHEGDESEDVELTGRLEVNNLTIPDATGSASVQGASLHLTLPARIAVTAEVGSAASAFAKLIARRPIGFSGEVRIAGRDLTELPLPVVGRRIAYAGVEPILFPGSIRDNVLYGLRHEPLAKERDSELERRRWQEALRTGNPPDNPEAEWIDLSRSGASNLQELEDKIIELLGRLGLRDDLYRFGLGGTPNPERYPELAERLLEARERLHRRLDEEGLSDLIEFFDPARYNVQATVAENLLFGVPTSQSLVGRALAGDMDFRQALDRAGLTQDLVGMGAHIAETMVDIFRGLPLGHPLFDQFSFVHADELGEFEAILKRLGMSGRGGATYEDRERLLALTLPYVEPRHRLGLLDEPMMERLLAGRAQFREIVDRNGRDDVRFYDPDTLNPAATVRDNLLFGRVNESVADARERVRLVGADIIGEMSLRSGIEHVGLDQQVGPAGRLLSSPQRAAVSLLRCIVKRPDILVIDGALAPFGEARASDAMNLLLEETGGRTLVAVLPSDRRTKDFDVLIRFSGGRAEMRELVAEDSQRETAPAAAAAE